MGKLDMRSVIEILVTIVLTSAGIVLGQSYVYAYVLLIFALILVVYIAGKNMMIRMPKLYRTQSESYEASRRIYRLASEDGGTLIATHINPRRLLPREDIALKTLRQVKKSLEYKRLLLIEDKKLEEEWIRNTLDKLAPEVLRSVYVIKPSALSRSFYWQVVPRANFLIFRSNGRYASLLGLDRLRTTEPGSEKTNLAIEFRSKKVYDTLHRYFESMTTSRFVKRVKSLYEYELSPDREALRLDIQDVISGMVDVGEDAVDILHIGIFGKIAAHLTGMQKTEGWEEPEADIDIMIFTEVGKTKKVKESVSRAFESKNIDIIWGDDPGYFYHFRTEDRTTIDIEIHERGTDFYQDHPLLGCSVFRPYETIYVSNTKGYLEDLVVHPYGFSSKKRRFEIFIEDRKGLEDFTEKLQEKTQKVDPRRIVSICIKNLAWAISGARPMDTKIALEFLSEYWEDIFPEISLRKTRDFLHMSQSKCKEKYFDCMEFSRRFVSTILNHARLQISEELD